MTDSGFSSAASSRSAPSIIKPGLFSSFCRAQQSTCSSDRESQHAAGNLGLPKPCTYATSSGCPSVKPSRLVYVRSHGGYSPGIHSPGVYSPKESMSPMSSLAFDFRDLNTSHEPSITPRKRLSLSSGSGIDSPLATSLRNRSPSVFSTSSAISSPQLIDRQLYDGSVKWTTATVRRCAGKQYFRPTRVVSSCHLATVRANEQFRLSGKSNDSTVIASHCDGTMEGQRFKPIVEEGYDGASPMIGRFSEAAVRLPLRDRDENVCDPLHTASGSKAFKKLVSFKSMPTIKARCRFTRASNVDGSGKENSPQLQPKKQVFMRRQLSNDSPPGPMHGLAAAATSSPAFCSVRRPSGLLLSPTIASSPVLPQFAASASSAFIAVQQGPGDEPELRVSPRDGGSTPEKSSVPGSIASLSARTAPRPSSSLPFYRNRHPSADDDDMFNQQNRPLKRSLDSANTSLTAASSKRVKCSDSFSEARSTRRKMAFGSNERKTKSAEAAFMTSSPMSDLKPGFRPISAPAQMLGSDDDAPLSHSRLCSSNDSDESDGDDDVMMTSSELERSENDEQLLEEMLSENVRAQHCDITKLSALSHSATAPSGLDGLITAPLLLDAVVRKDDACDASTNERLPKPRELFRSPSAPPVVPARRTKLALQRSQERGGDTPLGVPRARSALMQEALPEVDATSCEMSCENEEDTSASFLNRSRSFNELDVMRAVDLGCSDPNLVGDFSRVCSLPTVSGKEQDLKYITPETLIELMTVQSHECCFEVIDCRYPYEYDGGHIRGAHNVWQEQQMYKRYFQNSKPLWTRETQGSYKPPVLVFYCEFSSERGPRMARAIRSRDRELNHYPHLHYPELYVLLDGYKNFFAGRQNRNFCDPSSYRRMTDEAYARELRTCRIKSKTWAGEKTKHYNRIKHK